MISVKLRGWLLFALLAGALLYACWPLPTHFLP